MSVYISETLMNRVGTKEEITLSFDPKTVQLGFIRFIKRNQMSYAVTDLSAVGVSLWVTYQMFVDFAFIQLAVLSFSVAFMFFHRVSVNEKSSKEYYDKLLESGWTTYEKTVKTGSTFDGRQDSHRIENPYINNDNGYSDNNNDFNNKKTDDFSPVDRNFGNGDFE